MAPGVNAASALQAIENFQVNGQLAVATPPKDSAPMLRWQQQGPRAICCCARRSGWAVRTEFDGESYSVTNNQGAQLEGARRRTELCACSASNRR